MDLNADLGEGFGVWTAGADEAMLDIITSANLACGFHAGDPVIMRGVCAEAVRRGVAIGAQVGYRDLAGFGRRRIDIAPDDLSADVLYQLGALDAFARAAGDRVRYLKPHGALYHAAAADAGQAGAVVRALLDWDRPLPVLTLPGSALASAAAEAGLPVVIEAFCDRGYQADGSLVAREQPGAVLRQADEIADRALAMVTDGEVRAVDGSRVAVRPHSLCVHGDTPGAVEIAGAVRARLTGAGVRLAAFA
ncbi:LamB/YcsF family protein [Jatrophihabitans sp.]|uniref:LamB/YcsF family protein n=1 Tax=Jatrophihabitans sp. TaxID=1932789 RepID=UPI0038CD6597